MRLEVGEVKTGGKNRGKQNHGHPMGIPLDDPGIGPVGPSDLLFNHADQPPRIGSVFFFGAPS